MNIAAEACTKIERAAQESSKAFAKTPQPLGLSNILV
jgi:hypothetical protein